MEITGKKWYESKTLWFNMFSMVAGFIAIVQGVVTDPEILASLVLVNGLVNVILRVFFTVVPVGAYAIEPEDVEFSVK